MILKKKPENRNTDGAEEKDRAGKPHSSTVRLSVDVDHQTFVKLKTCSAITRRSVGAIVRDLISKHIDHIPGSS